MTVSLLALALLVLTVGLISATRTDNVPVAGYYPGIIVSPSQHLTLSQTILSVNSWVRNVRLWKSTVSVLDLWTSSWVLEPFWESLESTWWKTADLWWVWFTDSLTMKSNMTIPQILQHDHAQRFPCMVGNSLCEKINNSETVWTTFNRYWISSFGRGGVCGIFIPCLAVISCPTATYKSLTQMKREKKQQQPQKHIPLHLNSKLFHVKSGCEIKYSFIMIHQRFEDSSKSVPTLFLCLPIRLLV